MFQSKSKSITKKETKEKRFFQKTAVNGLKKQIVLNSIDLALPFSRSWCIVKKAI